MVSRRLTLMCLALASVMVIATIADAQQQGRGRGRGQRQGGGAFQGRGGFGFGGGFGGGDSLLGLLRMEEVRKEIDMVPEQVEQVTKLQEELRPARDQNQQRPNFRDLSEEERNKLFAQMREEAEQRTKKAEEKLATILFPPQMERLEELKIQRQGVQALNDEKVIAKLQITPEQKDKIAKVQEENQTAMREQMQALFQAGGQGGDRAQIGQKMQEMRAEAEKKVVAVLTQGQQKQFQEMQGEKFEFPAPAFGRGGPGGRRGPGAAGRPGGAPRRPGADN